jgi:hypothetical protein
MNKLEKLLKNNDHARIEVSYYNGKYNCSLVESTYYGNEKSDEEVCTVESNISALNALFFLEQKVEEIEGIGVLAK